MFMDLEVRLLRGNHAALWRVIYIARGEKQAQEIEALLTEAGFLVDRRQLAEGPSTEDVEIKALDSEAEEARLYLMEHGF